MLQSTALDILKTGENVFLTGSAGSGKTYTLNQYIHYLRARRVPVAVTASTGIAATHMSGVTIHSWSGIGIKDDLNERDLSNMSRKRHLTERIKDTSVLIIDEISMLHAKQLDLVNTVLKHVRQSEAAFGGMQVIVAGDFFQLPPVGARTESNRDKFAFMSAAWLEANFHICYLTEQHRQDVNETTENVLTLDTILNQIRQQAITYEAIDVLRATQTQDIQHNRTRLYTHNINVNKINERELEALSTEPVTFSASAFGEDKLVETLKKNVRTSDELILKVGAKVMFIKNNSELGVSNGSMGEVIDFKPAKADKPESVKLPVIQLNGGDKVMAEAEEWVIEDENGEVLASYSQIPLALAWAITIHKSQGMTLEAAEIDLSKTFELGQGYVALSRLKSLAGLQLLGMNEMSLQLDPLARGADRRFQALSAEMIDSHAKLEADTLSKAHDNFILKSGGTLSKTVIDAYEIMRKKRQERLKQQSAKKEKLGNQMTDKSTSTLLETRLLLEESLSIAEVAQARELSQATIMRHLNDIKQQDPDFACEHLRPSDEVMTQVSNAYAAIKAANDPNDFNDDGIIKLKPIYEHLRETIDYNTIRLALIFITP